MDPDALADSPCHHRIFVGTLDARDQHYLAENFLAFFKRDYRRVASLHIDSSWVPAGTRVDELESAVRAVCEPIFNKSLKDISFGLVLLRLFQTARQFNMEVQPQLVLLHVASILWTAEHLTDGYVPDRALISLSSRVDLAPNRRRWAARSGCRRTP